MTDAAQQHSPLTRSILSGIADTGLAGRVEQAVDCTAQALDELKKVHLPQDTFEDSDSDSTVSNRHIEIAPYALSAVASINRLLQHLADSFAPPAAALEPAGDDFDFEFDLVDGPAAESLAAPAKASHATLSDEERVADAAHAFGGMLRTNLLRFADRLELALQQDEPWPLLAELDDYKRKLSKGLQGLLFGVLGVFAKDARRDEILPDYQSSVGEAVALRSTLADLTLAVTRFNNAIAQASAEQVVPLVVAVSDRLQRFAGRPEYRTLRADDKKSIIDFRTSLYRLRRTKGGVPMVQLKHAVEGFSKFLEAMSAINHREVLVLHDKQRLEAALERLTVARNVVDTDPEAARNQLDLAVDALAAVHGRNQDLDDQRRLHRIDPPEAADMKERLDEWFALVEMTLQRVG